MKMEKWKQNEVKIEYIHRRDVPQKQISKTMRLKAERKKRANENRYEILQGGGNVGFRQRDGAAEEFNGEILEMWGGEEMVSSGSHDTWGRLKWVKSNKIQNSLKGFEEEAGNKQRNKRSSLKA